MQLILKLFLLTVFPIILSNFDVAQFRTVGWFNVAIGVVFLILEVAMFQGEWKNTHTVTDTNEKPSNTHYDQVNYKDCFCTTFVSTTFA